MTNDTQPPVAPVEGQPSKDKPLTAREAIMRLDVDMAMAKAGEGLKALIAAADAVCDYADSHCRAFPIATAPADGTTIMVWDGSESAPCWETAYYSEARAVFINDGGYELTIEDLTHWRPLPPPPTNPPLPAVFVELGAALEKIKGAG